MKIELPKKALMLWTTAEGNLTAASQLRLITAVIRLAGLKGGYDACLEDKTLKLSDTDTTIYFGNQAAAGAGQYDFLARWNGFGELEFVSRGLGVVTAEYVVNYRAKSLSEQLNELLPRDYTSGTSESRGVDVWCRGFYIGEFTEDRAAKDIVDKVLELTSCENLVKQLNELGLACHCGGIFYGPDCAISGTPRRIIIGHNDIASYNAHVHNREWRIKDTATGKTMSLKELVQLEIGKQGLEKKAEVYADRAVEFSDAFSAELAKAATDMAARTAADFAKLIDTVKVACK